MLLVASNSSTSNGTAWQDLSPVVVLFETTSAFFSQNTKVFAVPGQKLGWTNLVEHSINIGNAASFRIPYRRFMHSKREALETEVGKSFCILE